jgi:translation initiation factor IF-1
MKGLTKSKFGAAIKDITQTLERQHFETTNKTKDAARLSNKIRDAIKLKEKAGR